MENKQIAKFYLRGLAKGDKTHKTIYLEALNPQGLESFLSISKDDLIALMKSFGYSSQLQDEILSVIETVKERKKLQNQQPNTKEERQENEAEDSKSEEPEIISEDEKDPLTVHEVEEPDNSPVHEPDYSNSPEWIQEKCHWYQDQNLPNFKLKLPSEHNSQEFEAEFNGATIHYTSPNDVSISQDADFKIYDTILKDPDNQNRTIEFPINASTHLSTMLFAASIINGNNTTGFDIDKFDINLLKQAVEKGELTADQLSIINAAYQERRTPHTERQDASNETTLQTPIEEINNEPSSNSETFSTCQAKLTEIRSKVKNRKTPKKNFQNLSGRTNKFQTQYYSHSPFKIKNGKIYRNGNEI